MYNARRTAPLIYPPLSSIPKEPSKRSLKPDGRAIYESLHMDYDTDDSSCNYQDARHQGTSHFGNYKHYDDGTFAVLSRQPANDCNTFRL
jgi:hypothetical protein